MVDKQTIGVSSLITLGLVLASMVGPGFFDAQKFYCEAESSIMECSSLSGGSQTRCYLNEEKSSWDYCRSGWLEITEDLVIQEEPEETPAPSEGIKWECFPNGCVKLE